MNIYIYIYICIIYYIYTKVKLCTGDLLVSHHVVFRLISSFTSAFLTMHTTTSVLSLQVITIGEMQHDEKKKIKTDSNKNIFSLQASCEISSKLLRSGFIPELVIDVRTAMTMKRRPLKKHEFLQPGFFTKPKASFLRVNL